MASISGRTGLPSGESPLDARLCAEAGEILTRRREALGLSIAQVSEALLLSPRQVRALEVVEFAAFHNATFHVNALRKYGQLVDLNPTVVANIAAALTRPDPAVDDVESATIAAGSGTARGLGIAAVVVLLVAIVAGAYFLFVRRAAASADSPTPTSPREERLPSSPAPPRPSPLPTQAGLLQPAVAPVAENTASGAPPDNTVVARTPSLFGVLSVKRATWIFVRDADGMVTERSLREGQSFEFETQPTYLAVGTTDAELTIGSAAIDLSRFVANGQIRIRAGDFDALVQGATPIPAPTAAR